MAPSRVLRSILVIPVALLWPTEAPASELPSFVGSQSCGACHQPQLQAWTDSHHRWALREPTPQSVLGDFDDARFEHQGVTSRFFREDGRFLVETDGADGKPARFEVKYVVGVAPLQQYLVELDRGRLQVLDIAWDVAGKRWYHLYPDEDVAAGNGLHWTGPYKNWQARCAVCHQTDFRKNYDAKSRSYASTWSELTIGCEACHGPGEAHVAWARQPAAFDPADHAGVDARGLLSSSADDRQAAEVDMCGPCHARRQVLGPDSTLPTAAFADHYALSTLGGGRYFPDGQQDEEVYILGSFLQSKMHEKGVTCTNCHEPHSAKTVAEGNAVCTQCHNEAGRDGFASLKRANYDSPAHHHHPADSEAAQCVACHMPERRYMVIDGRRDHFFRIPDPLLSEATGAPDACRSCHAQETAQWAADAIEGWAPGRGAAQSGQALIFQATAKSPPDHQSLATLAAVALDTSKPAIVRASALGEMANATAAPDFAALAGLLSDDSELVRAAAARLWRGASPTDRAEHLEPLLSDPAASVRVAAARELISLDPADLPQERREALAAGLAEVRASMAANADFPEGQMAIGGLAMATRNWAAAQSAFAEATLMDPQLVQAWLTRARIAEALGNVRQATEILGAARARNPDNAGIAAQLGELLMRQGRFAEAVTALEGAVAAAPGDQDMRINLAFAMLQTRDLAGAAREIERLRADAPQRPEVMMLDGLHQVASGDIVGARETVREIERRHPGVPLPPALRQLSRMP